jgi:hypothetical protein
MTWLFEWNWLGYLWAFFVGFPLLMVALMFADEVASMRKTGYGVQGTTIVITIFSAGIAAGSLVLGGLTMLVWDFRTAIWLAGGALTLLVLIFGITYLSMRLIRK